MEVKDAPVQLRLDHNTGDYVPYSYRTVSGFFNVPYFLISNKGYETGPPVYSPYPRRLESLTICRCNYKGSTLSSVIFKTLSVGPAGVELTTSRMTARCSTNWATGARWLKIKMRSSGFIMESKNPLNSMTLILSHNIMYVWKHLQSYFFLVKTTIKPSGHCHCYHTKCLSFTNVVIITFLLKGKYYKFFAVSFTSSHVEIPWKTKGK